MSDPRRRAIVFTGNFLPHLGGVEVYVWQLWRRLVQRGWQAIVVASDVGGGPPESELDGFRVLRLPVFPFMQGRFPLPRPSPRVGQVFRELDAFQPSVVVSNIRFMPPSWLGAWYARSRQLPLLHIEHTSGAVSSESRLANAVATVVDRTMGRAVVKAAAHTVGVSEASAAFVDTLGGAGSTVLPSGVEEYRDPEGRQRWRDRLGLKPQDVALLFVGRVVEDKGVLVFLDAWERMKFPERAHVVIAGMGPALAVVRQRAERMPRVQVLGGVPPADVGALMAACDVFVHPSSCAEGGPLSVLEAAAVGLPIVATPQGVTGQLITSRGEGWRIPEKDPGALASALEDALRDGAGRVAKGRILQQKVLERYGWAAVLDEAERQLLRLTAMVPSPMMSEQESLETS